MIQLTKLQHDFGDTKIILSDFCFENGKSYCILGPSGCGKTTLLKMVSGLLQIQTGKVQITLGEEIFKLEEMNKTERHDFKRRYISYISQDLKLFEDFSVKDNLGIREKAVGKATSYHDLLEQVKLSHKLKAKVKHLSGGEKQRVAIARALMAQGQFMLCDEPTAALNSLIAKEIIELLIGIHKEQKNTLIVVTHDERLVSYFDEVVRFEEIAKWEVK